MAANGEPVPRQRDEEERDVEHDAPTEQTPLIASDRLSSQDDLERPRSKTSRWRWPSLAALLVLCIVVVLIIVFAFIAPSTVEQYAQQAVVFEPTSLSIDSFTSSGVRARVQGTFRMDGSRVHKKSVRDLGRFCTWIASAVESGESDVEVSLLEYGNVVLGTAHIPPITVSIQDGHTTAIDFLSDLKPGDIGGIRSVANDWIEGRLGQLSVVGKAAVPIKSGIFSLGTQMLQQEMLFANKDIPALPAYEIRRLNFHEVEIPSGKGMAADVSLLVKNDYPVEFTVPPLGFGILVDGCKKNDPYIMLADAITDELHIRPKHMVEANVTGTVRQLPAKLTQDCPGTENSPLDLLLGKYIHGEENTVYVQGSESPSPDTPRWITDLIGDIIVPVPVPGRTFGHFIKNFSLADTHFSLPSPWAEPNTPESNPRISAKVRALVALPEEINFNISVGRVRADADVFYKGSKLGRLDLHKWQQANSTSLDAHGKGEGPTLSIQSIVEDAPLYITDEDVFSDIIEQLLFGSKGLMLHIKADVDVEVETALGEFAIRRIPAEGEVPVKPIALSPPGKTPSHGKPGLPPGLQPKISELQIVNTSADSLSLSAVVNLTNPTPYFASIPYVNVHILKNVSLLGHATAQNLSLIPGANGNLHITALYSPFELGGSTGAAVGKELLSQYISGWNTTITLRLHEASFPGLPWLGRALSRWEFEAPAPRLRPPGDGNGDEAPGFIRDATMHLFTSTATFMLLSPLKSVTLWIDRLNATALYPRRVSSPVDDGDDEEEVLEPVGSIFYDEPFAVPPLAETPDGWGARTPAMPVEWSLDGVGYEAVRKALGGQLRLAAEAIVGVRVGRWQDTVWFRGRGLGVGVRL